MSNSNEKEIKCKMEIEEILKKYDCSIVVQEVFTTDIASQKKYSNMAVLVVANKKEEGKEDAKKE
jgi:hypothetical protein